MKSLQQQKHNQRTNLLQCNTLKLSTIYIFGCVCELVFESLYAIDTFTKRKSVTKQRDKACKQDINRILLSGLKWRFGFEWFGIQILQIRYSELPIPSSNADLQLRGTSAIQQR